MSSRLRAETVAPYFVVAALVHAGAVASRFDGLTVPPAVALAIMVAQFPLLVLSGYFEGRIDHGGMRDRPRWMQLRGAPVKLAFTLAMIYLCVVAAQTWDLTLGPLDASPPVAWPMAQRAAWFGMFTVGMCFPFYLMSASVLVPLLRVITAPLRALPAALGALLALGVGGGLGVLVMSAVTSTRIGAFAAHVKATVAASPGLVVGILLATTLGPLAVGLVAGKKA